LEPTSSAGAPYDAAGLPNAVLFANGTREATTRDAMHRPLRISALPGPRQYGPEVAKQFTEPPKEKEPPK